MNVKRYFAPTAREALRALKEALGPDAIVLSNRAVEGGVEILALPGEAVGALQAANRAAVVARAGGEVRPAAVEMPAAAARSADDADFRVSLSALAASAARNASRPVAQPAAEPATVVRAFNPPRIETADYALRSRDGVLRAAAAAQTAARPAPSGPAVFSGRAARSDADEFGSARVRELQETNARLMAELTGIRGMIERQLAGFAWGETRRQAPARAAMLGELLEAGFSAAIARKLVEAVHEDADRIEAREAVGAALDRLMRACASDEDLLDRGGVYALVGPTGVGKTTTIAKLAANLKLRERRKVGLITIDTYRIAAIDQLKKYADILGSSLKVVSTPDDIRQAVAGMNDCEYVLIDTAGRSPNDTLKLSELKAFLAAAGVDETHLVLSSTSNQSCVQLAVERFGEVKFDKIIFTKLDEAAQVGVILSVVRNLNKSISYITTGQDVPDDIEVVRGRRLAQLILGMGL